MRHAVNWYTGTRIYACFVHAYTVYACLAKAHIYVRQKYAYTRVQKTHIYALKVFSKKYTLD